MKKLGICLCLLAVALQLAGCSQYRKLSTLTPQERERIDNLLSQRKLCLVNEIEAIDDGKTDVEYVTEIVSWKCGKYLDTIKDVLYHEYRVNLGEAWVYTNDLRQVEPREIKEAVIQRRRAMQKGFDDQDYMRRQREESF